MVLKVGDDVQTLDGMVRIRTIESKEVNNSDLPLYTFIVTNDHSYFADGYCVHNGKGGSGKGGIVCTSMYKTTGLQDWRRAMDIWALYHKKVWNDQRPIQAGYHWMFKSFVRGMRKSKVLRFIGAWLARHVTNHMRTKLYKRGIGSKINEKLYYGSDGKVPFKHNFRKTDITGKVILVVLEPILWTVGRVLKMLNMDKGEQ